MLPWLLFFLSNSRFVFFFSWMSFLPKWMLSVLFGRNSSPLPDFWPFPSFFLQWGKEKINFNNHPFSEGFSFSGIFLEREWMVVVSVVIIFSILFYFHFVLFSFHSTFIMLFITKQVHFKLNCRRQIALMWTFLCYAAVFVFVVGFLFFVFVVSAILVGNKVGEQQ